MAQHSRAPAAEKPSATAPPQRDTEEDRQLQREVNPLWHNMATSVGAAGGTPPPGDGGNPVQRVCAACAEEQSAAPVQAKVTVGAPNDGYEQEADAVADTVMRMPAGGSVREQEGADTLRAKPLAEGITPLRGNTLRRACAGGTCEQDDTVQRDLDLPEIPEAVEQPTESGATGGAGAETEARGAGETEGEDAAKEAGEDKAGQGEKGKGAEGRISLPQPGPAPTEEEAPIQASADRESEEKPLQMQSAEEADTPLQTQSEGEDAEQPLQMQSSGEDAEEPLQMQSRGEEQEKPLQTKASTGAASPASAHFQSSLSRSKGGGRPLDGAARSDMESSFGRDFGDVRVHTDDAAVRMNEAVGAHAFTHGSDIYFGSGRYRPGSSDGRRLLAHELTHTVQQGSAGERVQRWTPGSEPAVSTEGRSQRPSDGAEVQGRMNNRIANDPDVQEGDDLDEEERREKRNPDRGEVRSDTSELNASGESRPSVDRGAAAQEKTQAQREAIDQKVNESSEEANEEGGEEGEEEAAQLTEAEQAAQRAQAAEQAARAVEVPARPEPFRHPRMDAPVDAAGQPLPRNAQVDTQVRGLGYIGEMLREKGYELKRHAAEQEIGAWGNEAALEKTREDLANAREGTATMQAHNAERREILDKSRGAHADSVQRQQYVAEKAPEFASKAQEGEGDAGALAAESSSRAEQSQSEIPDDPDARADAEQQSAEMGETSEGAASMDRAITQTGERARQYQADAEQAATQNEQSQTNIDETRTTVEQTDARIAEMQGRNEASQGQIDNAADGPARIRAFARQTASSGDELIAATYVMEEELLDLQEQYLNEMAAIESREDAERRLREEAERNAEQPEMPEDERRVVELHAMSDEEQAATIATMDQEEKNMLLAAIDRMISRAPESGTDATEGRRLRVDTGGSRALGELQGAAAEYVMGEDLARATGLSQGPPDPRQNEIQQVEGNRIQRVGGVLDIADQNMTFLSEEQQRALANRLVADSITSDIANINVLQMGKQMLLGMVNPVMALQGVVGGFDKMLTGLANIGNLDAWRRDPLGNLLQIAADVSTGLAMIFSSILGIAALITALMVVLTIISWGTLSPVTGPVIGWMGTVMTYAGWGAIISGALAVYFNYLAYIKNLHDAGTADTARELFGNTEQMRQNANDGFTGAMAVVEGVTSVKMGPRLSGGDFFANVPRSPGAWARQTVDGVRSGARAVGRAPARIAASMRRLFSAGRQGLVRFKDRLLQLFRRRRPGADLDVGPPSGTRPRTDVEPPAPTASRGDVEAAAGTRREAGADTPGTDAPRAADARRQALDEARSRPLRDMDAPQRRAEMDELAGQQPRRVDPDSPHAERYDIEIESNGHTYRRNRPPRRGWCRFSAQECGIPEGDLPQGVQQRVRDVDADLARRASADSPSVQTGRQQAAARGWPGDAELPEGYRWVRGPDGAPILGRKPGNSGPRRRFDPDAPADAPVNQRFPEVPATRRPRLRDEYLGSTPGKRSRTGREVIDRMRRPPPEGGRVRGVEPDEEIFVQGPDGRERWYPIDDMDMGHRHDAVTYWNETGYRLGPRHPEVRRWMLDPDNYELEHFSVNRSRGSQLGQTARYRPPEPELG